MAFLSRIVFVDTGEMMFNEPSARATRHGPVIANSHEAGAERAHVYSILAATMNICDDVGHSARRRYVGDDILPLKEQRRYFTWGQQIKILESFGFVSYNYNIFYSTKNFLIFIKNYLKYAQERYWQTLLKRILYFLNINRIQ